MGYPYIYPHTTSLILSYVTTHIAIVQCLSLSWLFFPVQPYWRSNVFVLAFLLSWMMVVLLQKKKNKGPLDLGMHLDGVCVSVCVFMSLSQRGPIIALYFLFSARMSMVSWWWWLTKETKKARKERDGYILQMVVYRMWGDVYILPRGEVRLGNHGQRFTLSNSTGKTDAEPWVGVNQWKWEAEKPFWPFSFVSVLFFWTMAIGWCVCPSAWVCPYRRTREKKETSNSSFCCRLALFCLGLWRWMLKEFKSWAHNNAAKSNQKNRTNRQSRHFVLCEFPWTSLTIAIWDHGPIVSTLFLCVEARLAALHPYATVPNKLYQTTNKQ